MKNIVITMDERNDGNVTLTIEGLIEAAESILIARHPGVTELIDVTTAQKGTQVEPCIKAVVEKEQTPSFLRHLGHVP